MKIMRRESWRDRWACRRPGLSMRCGVMKSPRANQTVRANPQEHFHMQWQTPTAIDFRFGFEITMYVANR
jgi:coenzyme PQQ precursor peptide PqqA